MNKVERILQYFPEKELPVFISDEHISIYETENETFPKAFVDEIILEWENAIDEFTEFIPCFRLPKEENFNAILYWKGGLLKYEFILATIDKNGGLISKKSIANTIVNGNIISRSVASIESDLIINIIAGQTIVGFEYDPTMSKAFTMEILHSGQIIFTLDSLN